MAKAIANQPYLLIAGPCVIENRDILRACAGHLKRITNELGIPFYFKASFDKANRSSIKSYRGPGMDEGLKLLAEIKTEFSVRLVSDIHSPSQAEAAAGVLDILQVPAFLCRQTDLLLAAAKTGKKINVKKGQFLAPWDMKNVVDKIRAGGNDRVMITERGTVFGYNNLAVDFRSIPIMQKQTGCPVIFDATHSVQLPGGMGSRSGGRREFAPILAKAAMAAGADGLFIEVHPDPDEALCDGPNSLRLESVKPLLKTLLAIRRAARGNHAIEPE